MNLTANEMLILVIGVFLFFGGISYWYQTSKTRALKSREKTVSIALLIVGLILILNPFWMMIINGISNSNESERKSMLMGPEVFKKEKTMLSPENGGEIQALDYAEAAQFYAKASALWNMTLSGYDSTDQVEIYLSKSIELYPTAEAYTAKGQLYTQLGDIQEAVELYGEAIAINPEFGNAYFNRAAAHYIMGNRALACTDWGKATEYGVPGASDIQNSYCN